MSHRRQIKPAYVWATLSDDDAPICAGCNGSGEGMFDGTRCSSCGGSGVEYHISEDERDTEDAEADAYAEAQAEDRWIAQRDRTASQ